MDLDSIEKQVNDSVQTWQRVARNFRGPAELTEGAKGTLTMLILKIETDPSPAWEKFDPENVQRFALSSIPAVLNEVSLRQPGTDLRVLSTWELMHAMSGILDHFCPIPKGK